MGQAPCSAKPIAAISEGTEIASNTSLLLRQLAELLGLAMIINRAAVRVLSTTVLSHPLPGDWCRAL